MKPKFSPNDKVYFVLDNKTIICTTVEFVLIRANNNGYSLVGWTHEHSEESLYYTYASALKAQSLL